ncbi:MAG TPA: substrate-binding domain-containing protein, partial [Acidimicrobiia bacterium]
MTGALSKRLFPLGLVAVVGLITACGSGSSGSDETLVIYSGRAEELVSPLFARFTEETGIGVEIRYGGSSELAATLIAEGDGTEADVFFAQDPASLGTVDSMMKVLDDATLDLVDPAFNDR